MPASESKHTVDKFSARRALLIGIVLILVNCYWVIKTEIVIASIHGTVLSVLWNVTFTVFLVSIVNTLAHRLTAHSFSSHEILVIYVMLAVATGLFGIDMMTLLVPIMGHAFWFATPENEWKQIFWQHLPQDLVVGNLSVLKGYYEGESNFWQIETFRVWLSPMLLWLLFIISLFLTTLFINAILRKGWVEHERLSYPVIQLPMEMASGRFYTNRGMWIGFGIAFTLDLLAGMHALYPVIPAPRVKWYNLAPLFSSNPWNAIDWLPVHFYPFATGLGYLMPLDLSFSVWFFYLFWKAQLVLANALGWHMTGKYLEWEKAGAWFGIAVLAIWTSRREIWRVFRSAIHHEPRDVSEPVTSRTAVLGTVLGFAALIGFWTWFGMQPVAAVAFFVLYLLFSLAATRMRAELGPPTHELHFAGPDKLMTTIVGSKRFSASTLSGFALLYWTNYGYRSHPMPHQLEGLKIAELSRTDPRSIFRAQIWALVVGAVATFLVLLWLFYQYGGVVGVQGGSLGPGWETYDRLARLLSVPESADHSILNQFGFGLGFSTLLLMMRRRFLWWPFHPIGFAVASGWSISWMWFSIFLGWLCKWMFLKLAGLRGHRQATPFFLGIILGQMTIGSVWSIVGVILGRKVYSFFV